MLGTSSERIVRCSQAACFRIGEQKHGFNASSQLEFVLCGSARHRAEMPPLVRKRTLVTLVRAQLAGANRSQLEPLRPAAGRWITLNDGQ